MAFPEQRTAPRCVCASGWSGPWPCAAAKAAAPATVTYFPQSGAHLTNAVVGLDRRPSSAKRFPSVVSILGASSPRASSPWRGPAMNRACSDSVVSHHPAGFRHRGRREPIASPFRPWGSPRRRVSAPCLHNGVRASSGAPPSRAFPSVTASPASPRATAPSSFMVREPCDLEAWPCQSPWPVHAVADVTGSMLSWASRARRAVAHHTRWCTHHQKRW